MKLLRCLIRKMAYAAGDRGEERRGSGETTGRQSPPERTHPDRRTGPGGPAARALAQELSPRKRRSAQKGPWLGRAQGWS